MVINKVISGISLINKYIELTYLDLTLKVGLNLDEYRTCWMLAFALLPRTYDPDYKLKQEHILTKMT